MSRRIQKILDAEFYAWMKYPKVGVPLDTIGVENIGTAKKPVSVVHKRFMPTIIDSGSTGHFLNYFVETERRTWEITMQNVANLKRIKKETGKF